MKILVTGGAGFIGSHLVDKLIDHGDQVVVIDNLSTGRKENLNPKATFYGFDICSPDIVGIFQKEKPEIVFHLAAQISVRFSVEDPANDAKTNIIGSINVLENAKKYGIKKFIFASTGGVMYGDADIIPTPETYVARPLCPYGICKLSVEHYLDYYEKVFGLRYAALRFGNVYGPRQNEKGEAGVVAIFCGKMIAGLECLINGDGKQTRDYVYVKDIVAAAIAAMSDAVAGVYNIGTGKETDVNAIFAKLKKITGSRIEKIHGPVKKGEHRRGCLNSAKAAKDFGWWPKYDLDAGLKETAGWFVAKL